MKTLEIQVISLMLPIYRNQMHITSRIVEKHVVFAFKLTENKPSKSDIFSKYSRWLRLFVIWSYDKKFKLKRSDSALPKTVAHRQAVAVPRRQFLVTGKNYQQLTFCILPWICDSNWSCRLSSAWRICKVSPIDGTCAWVWKIERKLNLITLHDT